MLFGRTGATATMISTLLTEQEVEIGALTSVSMTIHRMLGSRIRPLRWIAQVTHVLFGETTATLESTITIYSSLVGRPEAVGAPTEGSTTMQEVLRSKTVRLHLIAEVTASPYGRIDAVASHEFTFRTLDTMTSWVSTTERSFRSFELASLAYRWPSCHSHSKAYWLGHPLY